MGDLAAHQQHDPVSLGHLIHHAPLSATRGPWRGSGFELRTDAWLAVRAGEGLLLSASGLRARGEDRFYDYGAGGAGVAAGQDLNAVYKATYAALKPKYGHWVIFDHCMPFDVTRCYDEVTQYPDPRIWTAERDIEMWKALES